MNFYFLAPILTLGILSGCAAGNPPMPAGMKAGQFVSFNCEEGKRFQARVAEGGGTVRVRYEGGYELDRIAAGVYEAEGWKLVSGSAGTAELFHNGKALLKNCKPA